MRPFVILLIFIGVIMITSGYVKQKAEEKPPLIEYRYIPRNFIDEQESTINLKNFYSTMFDDESVWDTYPFNTKTGASFSETRVQRY
jgi:hypothetical protein